VDAPAKAFRVVKKLAPEVQIGYNALWGSGIEATYWSLNGECCSHTFSNKDAGIPVLEKSLTIYLWAKLFPDRFTRRPEHTKWGL
jgi:hypothetical protein